MSEVVLQANRQERRTKLLGIGSVGCKAVLQVTGLRVSPEDIDLLDLVRGTYQYVDTRTGEILSDDLLRNGSNTGGLNSKTRQRMRRSLRGAGACIVAMSIDDAASDAATFVGLLARRRKVPALAIVSSPFTLESEDHYSVQRYRLENLYETFDSVLVVGRGIEKPRSIEGQPDPNEPLVDVIECITRNMMAIDIADAIQSRTFGGLSFAQGKTAAEATEKALDSAFLGKHFVDGTRLLLILVAAASQSLVAVDDAMAVAQRCLDPSAEVIGSSITDHTLLTRTRVTVIHLSARSNAFISPRLASAGSVATPTLTLFNIRNDSPLRAKKIAAVVNYFDDEDDEHEYENRVPNSDLVAFRDFTRLHPVGSRFEARVVRSTRGGVHVIIEGGFSADLAIDANSSQIESTQIGQRLIATVATVIDSRREIDVFAQPVDVPKLTVPILPLRRNRPAFELADFIVHPVDVEGVLAKVRAIGEVDFATFPLRVSSTIALPERIDDAFLRFIMEVPPAPLRARFLHPRFYDHYRSAFAVIGLFPSGVIRTVGELMPTEGVAELRIFSLWHLLDPENRDEDVHRSAARIAVDLIGLTY